MKHLKLILRITLILAAVWIPTSIFWNKPPFNTDKIAYTYTEKSTTKYANIPGITFPKPTVVKVIINIPITNPSDLGLTYVSSTPDVTNNPWFYPSAIITAVLIILAILL